MTMDRLTAMEVLVRVVETGSFSGAARLLRVGQPAISKTIAQLEERLGVSRLLRSSRGLTPTEAGQNFYKRAKHSIEEVDEAELAARDAGAGLAGRLRFSSGVTFRQTPHHAAAAAIPRSASEAHGRSDPRRPRCRLDRGRDRCGISYGDARRLHDGGAQDRTIASIGARHTRLFQESGGAVDAG